MMPIDPYFTSAVKAKEKKPTCWEGYFIRIRHDTLSPARRFAGPGHQRPLSLEVRRARAKDTGRGRRKTGVALPGSP